MTKSKKVKNMTKRTRKNNKCVYTDEVYFFKKQIKELKSKMKKTRKALKNRKGKEKGEEEKGKEEGEHKGN